MRAIIVNWNNVFVSNLLKNLINKKSTDKQRVPMKTEFQLFLSRNFPLIWKVYFQVAQFNNSGRFKNCSTLSTLQERNKKSTWEVCGKTSFSSRINLYFFFSSVIKIIHYDISTRKFRRKSIIPKINTFFITAVNAFWT